jgi:hypothetical protein
MTTIPATPWVRSFAARLEGKPDLLLSVTLAAVGGLLLLLALFAGPAAKAFVLAWVVLP